RLHISCSLNDTTDTYIDTLSLHDALPIFGAVGGQHRQPVGVVERAHQVVRGGLGRRIRRVGRVGRGLGEVAGLAEGAVDLVGGRSEEHTSELQSRENLVCRLLLEKKKM